MSVDEKFMREALNEAEKAFQVGEVPVGCVLVYRNEIISRAHNLTESKKDATSHAEMECLKDGYRILRNWRLNDCTLYSTLEPCSMCAGAILLSRISAVVWGAADIRQGADGSWIDVLRRSHPIHRVEVRSRILEHESSALMRGFFKNRRLQNSGSAIESHCADLEGKYDGSYN